MGDLIQMAGHGKLQMIRRVRPNGDWDIVIYEPGKAPQIRDDWPMLGLPDCPIRDVQIP